MWNIFIYETLPLMYWLTHYIIQTLCKSLNVGYEWLIFQLHVYSFEIKTVIPITCTVCMLHWGFDEKKIILLVIIKILKRNIIQMGLISQKKKLQMWFWRNKVGIKLCILIVTGTIKSGYEALFCSRGHVTIAGHRSMLGICDIFSREGPLSCHTCFWHLSSF